jgi:cytoskeletal protein RodZ
MESGDFGALPSPLQIKGFLRSYGGLLGLNPEALIEAVDLDPWTALATLNEEVETQLETARVDLMDSASSFESIGQTLQAQREILGLSLDDVAQHTHLRIRYLRALEAGAIDDLPSPVQGRGMLKNFADFLGLDSDELLLRFAEGLQARRLEKEPGKRGGAIRPKSRMPRRERRFLSRDLVIGILMALSLIVFIVWGALQVSAVRSNQIVNPTAPSIAEVLLPSATATLVPSVTPTVQSLLDAGSEALEVIPDQGVEQTQEVIFFSETLDGAVQVQVVARQRAWMRVTVDGDVEYDGRIIPGTAYGFAGADVVEIATGNGAGLQVFYNDQDLGVLGAYGEVINFAITVDGVQTPTPTITLTPTQTETPAGTPTPTPSQTPEATQTPAS